jgi:hypothetical protein
VCKLFLGFIFVIVAFLLIRIDAWEVMKCCKTTNKIKTVILFFTAFCSICVLRSIFIIFIIIFKFLFEIKFGPTYQLMNELNYCLSLMRSHLNLLRFLQSSMKNAPPFAKFSEKGEML